jgi:hypothetical protein
LPMNSFSWLPTSWADSEELSDKLGNIARRNGVRNPPTDLLVCMRPEAEANRWEQRMTTLDEVAQA